MSNYIYTNDGLVNADELAHYGVPGMRWGHKKAGYVTGFQAKRRATIAANEARKKSIAESRASGDKGVGSFQRANRKALNAKRKAYGESMKADIDHNRQLRSDKKELKTLNKALQKNRFGVNQNKVLSDRNAELNKSKTFAKKWDAAFKNGRGSKEYEAYEREFKRISSKYEDKYVDAWLKDNRVKSASDKGRNYVKLQLFYGSKLV